MAAWSISGDGARAGGGSVVTSGGHGCLHGQNKPPCDDPYPGPRVCPVTTSRAPLTPDRRPIGLARASRWGLWLWVAATLAARAADPSEARGLLLKGEHAKVVEIASKALKDRQRDEEWPLLLGRALLTTGRYPEARAAMTNALAKDSDSIRLRWLAREAFLAAGDARGAAAVLDDIKESITSRGGGLRDPASMVAFGRAALLLGADPKVVLDKIYAPAQKADPDLRDVYLARGDLALEKHDFDLAAKAFDEGVRKHPEDPDLLFGLAKAHSTGEREVMGDSLEAALKADPRHIPSLLLIADNRIDAEDYDGAARRLDEVAAVDPWQPDAWAYRAVLAHLKNDTAAETAARATALRFWTDNPRVDHLIGLKLSQKYRFAEGAAHQRKALGADPSYLPAKAQLANDLLRLGDEAEGWKLAQEVERIDGYDVAAHNLVTLHDTMAKYVALTNAHFVVRISSHEAEVYGPRVLALLERARTNLCAKYSMELELPTLVEIFAEQKDFSVRTFGMPDNPGYLGVCFGRVVTANGPAANKTGAVNWEAVLWHEFCHVVTLQKTANRMPRWLSEGISVSEELQADASWGQRMTPRYRSMVLGGELTPVSKLSGAFLAPKTPFHLQFAYFESALVVDFLVGKSGIGALKDILVDLRGGADINAAIAKHTMPMERFEKEFAAFATDKAKQLAPGLEWEKPAPPVAEKLKPEAILSELFPGGPLKRQAKEPALSETELEKWAAARPDNFWALNQVAQRAVAEKRWADAKAPLQKLVEKYPGQDGADSAYPLLASVHRALGETDAEREVLMRHAERDDEATATYLRLMELASVAKDWPTVVRSAQRFLAINPLVAPPYRYLAKASEAAGDAPAAIAAYATLLKLDPPNPSDIHYQLARLLRPTDLEASRRHVLQALEDAPRNGAALRLLLTLPTHSVPAAAPVPEGTPKPGSIAL